MKIIKMNPILTLEINIYNYIILELDVYRWINVSFNTFQIPKHKCDQQELEKAYY